VSAGSQKRPISTYTGLPNGHEQRRSLSERILRLRYPQVAEQPNAYVCPTKRANVVTATISGAVIPFESMGQIAINPSNT
jgi:hypothetical protein